jgi:hypothetical protein
MTFLSPAAKVKPLAREVRDGLLDQWRFVSSYPGSLLAGFQRGEAFRDVEAFCLFLGSGRSGHTLVGSLLNAHPNMVIGNELDVLQYLRYGVSRSQLYALILRQDEIFARRGRRWQGYDYAVPGQWQGRFAKLQVIGDKKSGITSLRLARDSGLLDRLRLKVGVPLRFIHHVRNPYDNIATMAKRMGIGLEQATTRYFDRAEAAQDVIARLDAREVVETRHERLVRDLGGTMQHLAAFLGVSAEPDYVAACACSVYDTPRRTRHAAPWSGDLIKRIEDRMAGFSFYSGHHYED